MACLRLVGKTPCWRDALHRLQMTGTSTSCTFLTNDQPLIKQLNKRPDHSFNPYAMGDTRQDLYDIWKRTAYGKMHVKSHYSDYRKIYVLSQHEKI